jgi:hypothetical protein
MQQKPYLERKSFFVKIFTILHCHNATLLALATFGDVTHLEMIRKVK